MGVTFSYATITQQLVEQIGNCLIAGESVVALGHRNSGKVFLKHKIQQFLKNSGLQTIIAVKFQGAQAIVSAAEALNRIRAAMAESKTEILEEMDDREILSPILRLGQQTNIRPILMASNVDALSPLVARQFLQEVRSAVDLHKLVVFLTGTYDLRELVFGPNSEFNVARHYVLQGFNEAYFGEICARYSYALNIPIDSEDTLKELWQMSGGNGYALKILLWTIVDWRTRSHESTMPIHADLIRSFAKKSALMRVDAAYLLHSAIRLIPLEPEIWESLRRLTVEKVVHLSDSNCPPSALNLSGIAQNTEDGFLKFPSPLVEALVCDYYDDLRLGDLYGRAGEWSKAFEFYRKVEPVRRQRPFNAEDRPDVDAVIRSLCASLHSESEKGPEEVCRLFALGCRYVLGFPETAFWRQRAEQEWSLLFPEYAASAPGKEAAGRTFKTASYRPGAVPIAEEWKRCAFALALQPASIGSIDGALVGDFETKRVVSPQRKQLFEELAKHFVQAHSHATSVERDRHRLLVRNNQADIINDILARLGEDVLNVGDILQRAAGALRNLGYRRISFCLVDPSNQRIEGVLDASDDSSVNLAEMTNWPLEGEYVDIHQKVIREGQPEIVDDAWSHRLTDKKAVTAGKLKAFAVVPLLDHSTRAIGTILVERLDQAPPSETEVLDFQQFGRQLASVMEQGERVNLMQCSLDEIPEPLLVIDPMRRVRYANRVASELLSVSADWRGRNDASLLPDTPNFKIGVDEALAGGRSFHHFIGVPKDQHYRGALLCGAIRDSRRRVVGAVLHIEDLNYVFQLLRAFEAAAKSLDIESLLKALVQALARFGHRWGRIYFIENEGENRFLSSKREFGVLEEEANKAPSSRVVKLQERIGARPAYWRCLDERKAVICSRSLANRDEPDATVITESNLLSILAETKDVTWLEFPLIAQREVGKITLQVDRTLTPKHYEFLKVLCEMASGLLDAFLRRERDAERKEGRIRAAAAHLSLAHLSHNIATRFAGLDPMIARYRGREKQCFQLKSINDELEAGYRGIVAVVNEAKYKLQVIRPTLKAMEAGVFFITELSRMVGEKLLVDPSHTAMWVRADGNYLSGAFSEIIQNAKEAIGEKKTLQIHGSLGIVEVGGRRFVKFVIEDNGPGVEETFKERIFDEFWSHHPGGELGTGLGLSFVRRVFEAHGGWAKETGTKGRGARFELGVPSAALAGTEVVEN